MTVSLERTSMPLEAKGAENEPDSRGRQLYDLAQAALAGYREDRLPGNVTAVYGEAAGDGENATPGLNVVVEGLGTISVYEAEEYAEVHLRAFEDPSANEHHYPALSDEASD
ncbi:MAG TPA: hypothetical protein VFZ58_03910 [Candidatus Saccharimonadales bacterium]